MRGVDSGLAFIFPGQGSQSVGMLAELAQSHGSVAETFAEASETLGYDLWDLVCNGPEERLNADLKRSMGKQVPVRTMTKLRQAANDFMAELQQAPERVMAYFQDHHVQYAA